MGVPSGHRATRASANPYTLRCADRSRAGPAPDQLPTGVVEPDERPPSRGHPQGARKRHARRQVRARDRPRLHERRAGAGAPADAAAEARRDGRPEHRRLRQRLPRLAARRLRPGAVGRRRSTSRRRTSSSSPASTRSSRATAVWGTQQLDLYPQSKKFDGVFGIWYGKGPGVDRCSDVFKHANMAGTAKHGGVIAIAGDDHIAKSSTAAHQSDHIFKACGLPVFFPSSVQDILDMGLHAFAMSRFAGVWSAMKTIQEIVESSASVSVDPDRVDIVLPEDFAMPPGGLHIRWPDPPLEQEARLMDYKWYAALAYVRANRLNHNVIDGPERPLRHHRQRQGLQRHAPGAARPRPRRRRLPPASASACTRSTSSGRSRRRSRATSPQGLRRSSSSRRSARSSSTS